jgi:hypothetical protein
LTNDINLPIEEGSEAFNEDVGDDNIDKVLISVEGLTSVRSTRPARYR